MSFFAGFDTTCNPPQATIEQPILADLNTLMEQIFATAQADPNTFYVHLKRMHRLRRLCAIGRQYERRKNIKRRQRRAMQRKRGK